MSSWVSVYRKCLNSSLKNFLNYNRCSSYRYVYNAPSSKKSISLGSKEKQIQSKDIRNIGIMAHIDAGKTTTTERMLFYSNAIDVIGEVHHGDTVTDYMEQERKRGITITSACVTFNWLNKRINLIDTPGHVDFTMEVERSLRVLDGAVTVIDASAGVEAQTLTVWKQAERYSVPCICYLNKMDKPNANVTLCLNTIKAKLHTTPLVLHYPFGIGKEFRGIVDLIQMKLFKWTLSKTDYSKDYATINLEENKTNSLYNECLEMRNNLIEQLADLDNDVGDYVLQNDEYYEIPKDLLRKAIRNATINRTGLPILMGSSYKNTGVQCLMDGIVEYLPSPKEILNETVNLYSPDLCAMAFKVIHNKQYGGVLVFVRVYSGSLKKGQLIYNINKKIKEKSGKVYIPFADEYQEVQSIQEGNVAIVAGLKSTMTGDTLVLSEMSVKKAEEKCRKENTKLEDLNENENLHLLLAPQVPDPVFFCSIEAPSLSAEKELDGKLMELVREDPSLTVHVNHDTGQTVLGGMGELHLDIIKERIRKESKLDVDIGKLQISYRECLTTPATYTHTVEKTIGSAKQYLKISLSTEYSPNYQFKNYEVKYNKENYENLTKLRLPIIKAINKGIKSGLESGPILNSPLIDLKVFLDWIEVGRGTSESFIIASTAQCLNKLLSNNGCQLMEPIMSLEIITNDFYSPSILSDIQNRRGTLLSLSSRNDIKVLNIECPLAELLGYSTALRTMTSGTSSFTMELQEYRIMTSEAELNAVQNIYS